MKPCISGQLSSIVALGVALLSAGCAADEPGHYFEIDVVESNNGCTESDRRHTESFELRLVTNGPTATLFVDGSTFATGSISGCSLSYQAPVFTEARPGGHVVRWTLFGQATLNRGDGCDAGDGWEGTETIRVSSSTDPSIERGCAFEMTTSGSWIGQVE